MFYLLRGQRAKNRVVCSFIIHHMVTNISKYGHVALNIRLLYTTVFLRYTGYTARNDIRDFVSLGEE